MGSRRQGPAAKPRPVRNVRIVRHPESGAVPAYRAARQLELYLQRLRMLERELAAHRAGNRSEAALKTSEILEEERALIRRFCADAGLDLPPELSPDD